MTRLQEELSLNAWAPLQTMLYDGWVLRFANGYSKRANSVNPIYEGTIDIDTKITDCEKLYRSKGLKSVFKITPAIHPSNLDELLDSKGYEVMDYTSVQIAALRGMDARHDEALVVYDVPCDKWVNDFVRMNKVADSSVDTMVKMLDNIVPRRFFAALKEGEETVACGLGVLQGKHIGLFDIVTGEMYRKRGYGERLVSGIMKHAKLNGAEAAYLQVVANNKPALALYEKLGFVEQYRYWYRVK